MQKYYKEVRQVALFGANILISRKNMYIKKTTMKQNNSKKNTIIKKYNNKNHHQKNKLLFLTNKKTNHLFVDFFCKVSSNTGSFFYKKVLVHNPYLPTQPCLKAFVREVSSKSGLNKALGRAQNSAHKALYKGNALKVRLLNTPTSPKEAQKTLFGAIFAQFRGVTHEK